MRVRLPASVVALIVTARIAAACTGEDVPFTPSTPSSDGGDNPPATTTDSSSPGVVCEGGTTACGSTCVDLTKDALHCGKCGRDCGGGSGSCVESQCVAQTVTNNFKNAHGVAVDESFIYFTVAGYASVPGEVVLSPVARIAKTGGVPEILSSSERAPVMISVYGADVYWSTWEPGQVRSTSIAGGTVRTLADGGTGLFDIRATDAGLYWAEFGAPGRVLWRPWGAATPVTLAELAQAGVTSVSVDEAAAYFTVQSGTSSVRRTPLDGGGDAGEVLVDSLKSAWGLAIDATHVYFTEQNGGTLKKIPKGGGPVTVLATNLDGPRSVIVDGEFAYVAEFALTGHVYRIPITGLDGGAPTLMASNQGHPIGLTQDKDFLYWANNTDGRIMKVRK